MPQPGELTAESIPDRYGVPYVRLGNGVEMPRDAYFSMADQKLPANQPAPPVPQAQFDPTQVVPQSGSNSRPVDPAAAAVMAGQSYGDVSGGPVPYAPVPQPPGMLGPPSAPQYHSGSSQRTSSSSSHDTFAGSTLEGQAILGTPPPAYDPTKDKVAIDAANAGALTAATEQSAALDRQAAAEKARNEFVTGPGGQDEQQTVLRQQLLQDRQEFEQHANEASQQYQQSIMQRMAAIPAEDPSRVWAGTEGKFKEAAGILASAIGGMLAVSTGSGKNLGLEALQHAISEDIAVQRDNIESEWKKVATSQEEYKQFQAQMGDQRAWMQEQAAYRYTSLASHLDAMQGTFTSQSKQAEIAGLSAQVMQQAEAAAGKAAEYNATNNRAISNDEYNHYATTTELALTKSRDAVSAAHTAAEIGKLSAVSGPQAINRRPNNDVIYLDPAFNHGDKTAVTKITDAAAVQADLLDKMGKYRQLVADIGRKYAGPGSGKLWGGEDIKTVRDAGTRLAITIGRAAEGGRFPAKILDLAHEMVGQPSGWTGVDPLQSQSQYMSDILDTMDQTLRGKGAMQVRKGPDGQPLMDANGQPVLEPLDTASKFGAPDVTNTPTGDLPKAVQDLGRTILTNNDPALVLSALKQLSAVHDNKLPFMGTLANTAFSGAKVNNSGGKPSVLYGPGDGQYADPVALMRAAAAKAAATAGKGKLASEITAAAKQLELRMRGKGPVQPTDNGGWWQRTQDAVSRQQAIGAPTAWGQPAGPESEAEATPDPEQQE